MFLGSCYDGKQQAGNANSIEGNGKIDDVAKTSNAEHVGNNMREEKHCHDAQSLSCRGLVSIADLCSCGDETCQCKVNASCDGNLPDEIKPVRILGPS